MSVKLDQDKKSPEEVNCQAGIMKPGAECSNCPDNFGWKEKARSMNGLQFKAVRGLKCVSAGYLLAWVSARAPMMGILKR
jgi:hypothetical protein